MEDNSSSDMGCGKDLAEGKNHLVIIEIGKFKTNKSIAERKNRCVMKDIGESVGILQKKGINHTQSYHWDSEFDQNYN